MHFIVKYSVLVCVSLIVQTSTLVFASDLDEMACPELRHGYGPYDYRTATQEQRVLVEGAHFFPNVENLRKNTPHPARGYIVNPGGEIDYTLRAFPNHPRALLALSRWRFQEKKDPPPGAKTKVACYFRSAIKFRSDDSMVRVIYGVHLTKEGNFGEAIEQFEVAKNLGEESASLYYNMGLAYFEMKRFPEALEAAHKAYAYGAQFPGLRTKLESVKAWREAEKKPDNPKVEDTQPKIQAD